ncbi:MAG: AI-2E family transporter [Pseudomonadota bacterium]
MSLARRQGIALAATLASIAAGLLLAGTLALPLVIGLLLALLLAPLVERLGRIGLPRTPAALLVTAFTGLLTLALALGVLPLLVLEIRRLFRTLGDDAMRVVERLEEVWAARLPAQPPLREVLQEVGERVAPTVEELAPALLDVLDLGGAVVSGLILFLLVPIVLYIFLAHAEALRGRTVALVPCRFQDAFRSWLDEVGDALGAYLRGQGLVCTVQAIVHGVGLTLIGLPFGWLIGLLTGLAALVPVLGNITMLVLALVLAAAQQEGWWLLLLVLLVYGSAQMLETLVLVPVLVGREIEIHPVLIIFAVMLGGRLFGLIGALLALPGTAVVVTTLRWGWQRYRQSETYRAGADQPD